MEKPLKTPEPITKGLTGAQLKSLDKNVDILAASSDERIKASAWRSIKSILKYIKSHPPQN